MAAGRRTGRSAQKCFNIGKRARQSPSQADDAAQHGKYIPSLHRVAARSCAEQLGISRQGLFGLADPPFGEGDSPLVRARYGDELTSQPSP
eukprot:7201057-Prymnesium_polylepis.1